jgi:hypothetical protein
MGKSNIKVAQNCFARRRRAKQTLPSGGVKDEKERDDFG